ncbi:carboxypeptidase-like regulatory domain-containing protein [Larkinella terrae]|uniref:Carboxypeptidase regulatory-like domain-containing protein n=1 Tax=Larkinella terrae TaxID=2025311 RepID=A0A7K0ET18_9BACT|nr:carboxypeptidase-like regulatory domain-containing protein [Larkinella terrae]MRS64558.1 carboxypeptidase regulatory-like domain-containing protein [Larkinella terrae]
MKILFLKTLLNLVRTAAFVGLLLNAGCSKSGDDPAAGGSATAGFLVGQVTDPQGKPLPGATILADNLFLYNSHLETSSDAKGNYRVKTPTGSYRAIAQIRKSYNGKNYTLDLKPDNTAAFAGDEGAVRNFQWQLTGEDPEQSGRHYGGEVTLDKDILSEIDDVENIEFTFTPVGPLIDGTAGKTLKIRSGEPHSNSYGRIPDVPIGRYKITAVHRPTGKLVQVKNKNGAYAADGSVTLDFYGENSPWACSNCLVIEYKER